MADNSGSHPSREQRLEQVLAEYLRAMESGQTVDRDALVTQYPELADDLRSFFRNRDAMQRLAEPLQGGGSSGEAPTIGLDTGATGDATRVRYFGDYELQGEIARGGMGVVYRARQVSLNRTVALKMILAAQLASADDVRRFQQEAEGAANLDHPHIVPIYEIGEHEGQHYFSMKLIEGGSLSQRLKSSAGSLPARETAQLMATVARAVHHAHQRGLLHRDLKPGNILLDVAGQPHVTDFGLAKRVEGDSDLTHSGAVVGTPAYMAPEQARAEPQLTTAVDVYSLGAILYELLVGRPPFRADSAAEMLVHVLNDEPAAPRSVNPRVDRDLETICLKCLEKEPARRYDSAAALADELERWLRGEPINARPASAIERALKWAKRRPAVASLCLAISLVLLGGIAGILWQWRNAETARREVSSQRDHTSVLLSQAQVVQGVRMLEENNPLGLLQLLQARETVEQLPEVRASRTRLWAGWAAHFEHEPPRVLDAEPASVVAVSPDGTLLATGNAKGIVKVWDAATLKQRNNFNAGDGMIVKLAFTPRPDELALSFGSPFNFRTNEALPDARKATSDYYNARTGAASAVPSRLDGSNLPWPGRVNDYEVKYKPNGTRQIQSVRDHTPVGAPFKTEGNVSAFVISPDGRTLATLSKNLELWSLETGQPLCPPLGDYAREGLGGGLAFSSDGRWLLEYDARYMEGGLQVWDAATGKPHGKIFPKAPWAPYPVVSPSCQLAITVPEIGKGAQIWDVEMAEPRGARLVTDGKFRGIVFSADDKLVATFSSDNMVSVWSTTDGKLLCKLEQPGVDAVAFHPDGKRLVLAGAGLRVYALPMGGQAKSPFREWAKAVAMHFSPRNELVVIHNATHEIEVFAANAAATDPPKWRRPFPAEFAAFAFSDDGSMLATADALGQVQFWRMADGQAAGTTFTSSKPMFAVGLSHDMRTFAGGEVGEEGDNRVRLWDVATGKPLNELKSPPMEASWMSLRFSPDDRFLGARSSMVAWEFWEVSSARHLDRRRKEIVFAVTSDWNRALATADTEQMFLTSDFLRDTFPSGNAIPMAPAASVDFSPDGKLIISSELSGQTRLINAITSNPHGRPVRLDGKTSRSRFGPTGEWFTVFSDSGSFRRWDTMSMQPLEPIIRQPDIEEQEWSPDARWRATITQSGVGRLWREPSTDLTLDEMRTRTWLITGHRMNAQGVEEPLPADEMQRLQELKANHSAEGR